eukprot:Filipodium_phascolosomae@DN6683_c0_g1_i1.p1
MRLAFGVAVAEEEIWTRGLPDLTTDDFDYAKSVDRIIKVVAIATTEESCGGAATLPTPGGEGGSPRPVTGGGPRVCGFVAPCMVPMEEELARVNGVTNAVEVTSTNLHRSLFVGPGAGRLPTANSIVTDVRQIMKARQSATPSASASGAPLALPLPFPPLNATRSFSKDFTCAFYIRFVVRECVGIIAKISKLMMDKEISIYSVLQNPYCDHSRVVFSIIVDGTTRHSKVCELVEKLEEGRTGDFSFLLEKPMYIPFL